MACIGIITSVITLYYILHPYVAEIWYSPLIKCPGKKYLTTTLYPLIGASNAHCLFAMLKYIPNGGMKCIYSIAQHTKKACSLLKLMTLNGIQLNSRHQMQRIVIQQPQTAEGAEE